MGISPSELNAMSLWEFAAMVQGWNRANGPPGQDQIKPEDEENLFEFIEEKPIWVN